jgi:hypothetical protein|nr:DUF4340 domain-containing protein [uncultured Oscillibacter sp.]
MEMDWRQRRTVTILTAVLLALLAAVLIVLGIRYRENREETPEDNESAAAAFMTVEGYSALVYSNGSTTLSFTAEEDGDWAWENDPQFPLRQETINSILALLINWRPQQTLAAEEDLSAYGLDEPAGALTLTGADGSVRALSFGKTTTDGTSRYVMEQSDPSTVYIIADTLFTQMSVPIYDMCDVPLLPLLEESAIRSILIRGPENEDDTPALVTVLTTAKRDGDGGPVTWLQGSENVTANETVRALLEDIRALVFSRCVDYDPSDEALTICGFDTPPAALTVNYTTDTGTEETISLTIGAQVLDGSGRYARLGDSTTIYSLPTAALDPLMRVAANGLDIT